MPSSLRVLFDAGPGNATESLRSLVEGRYNPAIGHLGYSDQLYRACADLSVPLLALCSHPDAQPFEHGGLRVERHDNPLASAGGVRYQLAHAQRAAQLLRAARAFRANVLMFSNEPYAALLAPARRLGLRLVQSLHCTLWREFKPIGVRERLINRANRAAYAGGLEAVLSTSNVTSRQVEQVAGPRCSPIVEFLPTFRAEAFAGLPSPLEIPRAPFRVMFIGRLEAGKGVFDLIELARRIRDTGRGDVAFDLCGDGSAMAEARARVAAQRLESAVILHGWCDAQRLREIAGRAHAVIVPTTSEFIEGFNHVVIEGLLYGRPVITSEVCPAIHYVASAVTVVQADDVNGYARAVLDLATDDACYERLCRGTRQVSAKFLDDRNSYASAVRHTLMAIARGERPADMRLPTDDGAADGEGWLRAAS